MRAKFLHIIAALILGLFAVLYNGLPAHAQGWPSNWPQAYIDALNDTMGDAAESEIYKNLTAIVPGNADLIRDSSGRVLVSTWGDNYYPDHYKAGDTFIVSPAHLVWVTVVPELKNWLSGHAVSARDLTYRLEQLYGMPPSKGKTVFVEFWVYPDDLFRPSPDPEITDHECELDFPLSPYTTISEEYKDWFIDERSIHYAGLSAMPWTRLGYTYDWGNPNKHFGLSEFVLRGNASCVINAITSTSEYCTLPDIVLDMGDETASPGERMSISACVPSEDQPVDIYLVLISPLGRVRSLIRPSRLIDGVHPYYSGVIVAERTCSTLLNYTVTANLDQGKWTAYLVLLPAGAQPRFMNRLVYDARTITITH